MRQSYHNFSQPILTSLVKQNNSLVKNIPESSFNHNQTTVHGTDQCSVLLNALSFRESTVAYADRLYLNSTYHQNPQNYLNGDNSIDTSISGQLSNGKKRTPIENAMFEKRDLVVNWIALIHTKYWFEQQTFHLAVSIIDRFLKKVPDSNIDFELLAVTAFWVAAKIQERKIKELKVWMKLGRGFYKDEILEMEHKILDVLEYQIIIPTSQTIIWELITNCTTLSNKSIHLALYILELSMMNSNYLKFDSGIMALSAIYLCSKIHGIEQSEANMHNLFLNHWDDVRKCSRKLCKTLQKAAQDFKSPIVRKFASKRYNQVAYTKFGKKSDSMLTLHSKSAVRLL